MTEYKIESQWIRIPKFVLHIRAVSQKQTNDKTPIVLVHGLSVSSRYMLPTIHAMAPYFPVYAPDLPGFGKSDKPSHVLSVPELADSLAACIEALGLKKVILL